jgi:hypothetical protein
MILSPNEIAWCATQAGWVGNDVAVAVAVALAESKGNTDALGWVPAVVNPPPGQQPKPASGNYDHGLWQISSLWHGAELLLTGANWRDPLDNAHIAFAVWTGAGGKWTPWSTFKSGAHELLMPFGVQAAKYPWAPPTSVVTVHVSGALTMNGSLSGTASMDRPLS